MRPSPSSDEARRMRAVHGAPWAVRARVAGHQRYRLRAMLTPAGTASLLELDPDLGTALQADEFNLACQELRVALLRFEEPAVRGKWGDAAPHVAGLLITEGALMREVRTVRRVTAEILGPGDLIRPFGEDGEEDLPVQAEITWRKIQPATLAAIDGRVLSTASRWPPIVAALVARAVRRSQRMSVDFSISHMVRIADRLLLFFWHLASHWGRVTPQGIVIDLPLTHSQLALMVGSERPSVTTALGQLESRGLVERPGTGAWLLRGDMPGEISALLEQTSALADGGEK